MMPSVRQTRMRPLKRLETKERVAIKNVRPLELKYASEVREMKAQLQLISRQEPYQLKEGYVMYFDKRLSKLRSRELLLHRNQAKIEMLIRTRDLFARTDQGELKQKIIDIYKDRIKWVTQKYDGLLQQEKERQEEVKRREHVVIKSSFRRRSEKSSNDPDESASEDDEIDALWKVSD